MQWTERYSWEISQMIGRSDALKGLGLGKVQPLLAQILRKCRGAIAQALGCLSKCPGSVQLY